jgi:hypothetical protein
MSVSWLANRFSCRLLNDDCNRMSPVGCHHTTHGDAGVMHALQIEAKFV